ncbi:MAG: TRAP transporter large permease [Azospirillaceae bacterium]
MSVAVVLIAFIGTIVIGTPIAFAIGIASVAGFVAIDEPLSQIGSLIIRAMDQELIIAIPFYVLAGLLLAHSRILNPLMDLCMVLLRRVRGGMIGVDGISSVMFGGMTGSGPAEAASLAAILSGPMEKQGYPRRFTASMAAAGGTLGLIIPPSGGYILYALITRDVSISGLFIAGILPGLLLAFLYTAAAYLSGVRYEKREARAQTPSRGEVLRLLPGAFLGAISPVVVLGGIYFGLTTVTEAAAVAVGYALLVGTVVYRSIGLRDIYRVMVQTGIATGVIMLVLGSAAIFSWLVSVSGWAHDVSDLVVGFAETPTMYVVLVAVIFLVAGTVLDGVSMYFILVPLLAPGAAALGIDPIYLGIVITVALAIGLITPPLGLDLFAAASTVGVSFEEIARAVLPLVLASLIGLAIIIAVPEISLLLVG